MRDAHIVTTVSDIKNPYADRRSKDWNKLPVIKAGSRFIVNDDSVRSSESQYAWEGRHSELGNLIGSNSSVAQPQTVREFKAVYNCDWSGDEILRILLKLGKIKPEDFAEVAAIPEDF